MMDINAKIVRYLYAHRKSSINAKIVRYLYAHPKSSLEQICNELELTYIGTSVQLNLLRDHGYVVAHSEIKLADRREYINTTYSLGKEVDYEWRSKFRKQNKVR